MVNFYTVRIFIQKIYFLVEFIIWCRFLNSISICSVPDKFNSRAQIILTSFYKPYNFERSCGLYFTASYRLHINHCLLSFIEFVGLFHYWKIWTTLSYINIIANYCCEKKQVKETLRLKLQHGRMLWHPLGGEETWSNNSLQKPGGG